MSRELVNKLFEEIIKMPSYDIHTHMDTEHLSARGLYDVLLYHMVITDMYSSGCKDGARMNEEPTNEEIESRIVEALPYIKNIQNTNCFWGVRIILKDLYGWDKPITEENWREIDSIIKEKYNNNTYGREILKKAKIVRVCTELWRRKDASADDVFQYSLEWAFFARAQYGKLDAALVELEYAWNMINPGPPMPVTADFSTFNFKKIVKTLDDVKVAMQHFIDTIPKGVTLNAASHLSTDIRYRDVSDEEMIIALKNRSNATENERDIYASYINKLYIKMMTQYHPEIVLQFSIGAEPLPYETGSKLFTETIYDLVKIFEEFSNFKFVFHVSSMHQNQAFCTVARELPNVYLAGYWWHNFYPTFIRRIIEERMEMLPMNKQFIFFSDAYCADWAYAKSVIIKKQLAEVLTLKIEQGQFTIDEALNIVRTMFLQVPEKELGMIAGKF